MNGRINSVMMRVVLFASVATLVASAAAQAINIDLDVGSGDPEQGNGAPSSSFGAAAGQPGFWNRVQFGASPVQLINTAGQPSAAVMTLESSAGITGGGYRNKSNTGDYALLLNDAMDVAFLSPGGFKRFSFAGLDAGLYQVYTYAVDIAGNAVDTPVFIAEAAHNQTQIVTGPMPGNAFEYLVTHSIHEVMVEPTGFSVYLEQPPGLRGSACSLDCRWGGRWSFAPTLTAFGRAKVKQVLAKTGSFAGRNRNATDGTVAR